MLVAVSVAATFWATRSGLAMGDISVRELTAGLNLGAGRGLRTVAGRSTDFGPALATLVAVGRLIGIDGLLTIKVLGACSFAATIVLTHCLARRHISSSALVWFATAVVSLSPLMLRLYSTAQSEPELLVVSLALLLVLEDLVRRGPSMRLEVAIVVLCWIAFFFRYPAMSFIPVVGVATVLGLAHLGNRRRFLHAAGLVVAATLAPIAWAIRNHAIDGTFLGPRAPSADGPRGTTLRLVANIGGWILPSDSTEVTQQIVGFSAFFALAILAVWTTRQARDRDRQRPLDGLMPILVFGAVYGAYMWTAQQSVAMEALNLRLLSPLYVPCLLVAVTIVDRAVSLTSTGAVRVALAFGAVAVVAVSALSFMRYGNRVGREGIGLSEMAWRAREAEVAAGVQRLPADALLFSDEPFALWALTGRDPIFTSPNRTLDNRSTALADEIPAFTSAARCRPFYFLDFMDSAAVPGVFPFLHRIDLDHQPFTFETVADFVDGSLYLVRPTPTDERPPATLRIHEVTVSCRR